jgi:hypothetical protein
MTLGGSLNLQPWIFGGSRPEGPCESLAEFVARYPLVSALYAGSIAAMVVAKAIRMVIVRRLLASTPVGR